MTFSPGPIRERITTLSLAGRRNMKSKEKIKATAPHDPFNGGSSEAEKSI